MKNAFFHLFFAFLYVVVNAQPGSTTESEVKEQAKMIDASLAFVSTQYEKAEKLYLEILDKNPRNDAARYELARTYCALKNYDKALQNAKLAGELDKKNSWYGQLLGDIYKSSGKFQEAASIFESLTRLEPSNEQFYFDWAECLSLSGEKIKAVKAFEQLEKRSGFDEHISRQKHVLYLELGDQKKAEKEIQKMINNEPDNIEFYHLLAGYYRQIGDKNSEQATYQRILSVAPNDSKANLAIAAQSKSSQSDTDYLSSLRTLFQNKEIALDAKIKELIPYVAKIADKSDTLLAAKAIELVQILDQVHPNEAKVYSIYGDLLYYSDKKDEALTQYQKTIKLNGAVFPVWEQIFEILRLKRDFDGLLNSAEKALDYFPNQAAIYYYQGTAYFEKQKYAEACTAFEQSIVMSGKNTFNKVNALVELSKAQMKLSKMELARSNLMKAQSLGGENSAEWLETFGDFSARNNDLETALTYWIKAKEKGSKSATLDKKISEKKLME